MRTLGEIIMLSGFICALLSSGLYLLGLLSNDAADLLAGIGIVSCAIGSVIYFVTSIVRQR